MHVHLFVDITLISIQYEGGKKQPNVLKHEMY